MRQLDSNRFVDVLVKEVNAHVAQDNWVIVTMEEKPELEELIPAVWAMQRKRNLLSNEITKYKARFNFHGGKQGIECYTDANFCSNWNKMFAEIDPATAKSCSGWIVTYDTQIVQYGGGLQDADACCNFYHHGRIH